MLRQSSFSNLNVFTDLLRHSFSIAICFFHLHKPPKPINKRELDRIGNSYIFPLFMRQASDAGPHVKFERHSSKMASKKKYLRIGSKWLVYSPSQSPRHPQSLKHLPSNSLQATICQVLEQTLFLYRLARSMFEWSIQHCLAQSPFRSPILIPPATFSNLLRWLALPESLQSEYEGYLFLDDK